MICLVLIIYNCFSSNLLSNEALLIEINKANLNMCIHIYLDYMF